jgi:hypothetical protein
MLSYLTWRWEIADVMGAITEIVELLTKAQATGGFDFAANLLKRVGRYPRERNSNYERSVYVTMPFPKHDFDIGILQPRDGTCGVAIIGLPRYAGFSFSCALPPRTFLAELHPDPVHGVSWRAQKLFNAIREDQARAATI